MVALTGKFGAALFDGFDDVYGEKPEPPPPPPPSAPTSEVILQESDLINNASVTLFNDVPLFASPERIELCEDDVLGSGGVNGVGENPPLSMEDNGLGVIAMNQQDLEMPDDFRRVLTCNHCYGPLHKTVFFIDRGFEEISEGAFDKNDILESDQLAFCSNDCVELYQGKIDYTIDDDVALVDAVKACLLYTSPSPRDGLLSRMPSSA